MRNYSQKSYLFIAGLMMMAVGIYVGVMPGDYLAGMVIEGELDVHPALNRSSPSSLNMLSELRGMGGLLLVFSIYILMSMFKISWRQTALFIAVMVYASFFVFRTLGFVLDGFPGAAVMLAYVIEVVMTLAGILLMDGKLLAGKRAPREKNSSVW